MFIYTIYLSSACGAVSPDNFCCFLLPLQVPTRALQLLAQLGQKSTPLRLRLDDIFIYLWLRLSTELRIQVFIIYYILEYSLVLLLDLDRKYRLFGVEVER